MTSNKETKIRRKMPNLTATSLIFVCILLAVVLTYLIPAGSFQQAESQMDVVLDGFTFTQRTPVHIWRLPELIIRSFTQNASVILAFFFVGGSVSIMVETGALQAVVMRLMSRLKTPLTVLIAFTVIFIVISLNIATRYLISFVPFMIALACSLGYDAITGVSIVLLGGAMSYCTSPTGLITLTAQSYVGLPPLSGAGFRWICLLCLAIPTIAYLCVYAEGVRRMPGRSILYQMGIDPPAERIFPEAAGETTVRDLLSVALYIISIGCCVYFGSQNALTTIRMSAIFLVSGVILAFLNQVPPNNIIDHYISAASRFFMPAAVVGLAGTIALVLESGGIIDTIIYTLASGLQYAPDFLKAPLIFLIQLLINCAIVPGSGQAAITMPLLGPVAELAGLPMQSAVLAFNFGDGLGDFILPYSSVLISYLAIGEIPFKAWLKFIWKLFAIWVAAACVLMYISTAVW